MSKQKRAIYFDIDGTLWDRANYIPESTKEAIRKLKENGHFVMICSGRCRGYIHNEELLSLGFDGIVSGCGTMIEYRGEVLRYFRVPKERALWTVETAKKYRMRPILEGREYLYLDLEDFKDDAYGEKLMRENGPRLRFISGTWGEWEFSKLSVDMRDADVQGCFAELSEYYDFSKGKLTVSQVHRHPDGCLRFSAGDHPANIKLARQFHGVVNGLIFIDPEFRIRFWYIDENGQERLIRVDDEWLYKNGIDEGSCWPKTVY